MMLTKLPTDILIHTVQYLDIDEKHRLMETCHQLRHLLLHNPICWSHLDFEPYPSMTDIALQTFIERHLLKNCNNIYDDSAQCVKSVVFLNLSGCQRLSSRLVTRMLKLFTGLRVLELNKFNSPGVIYQGRPIEPLYSIMVHVNYGISDLYASHFPSPGLHVCDSTSDTAAKLILIQKEWLKPKNQFNGFHMGGKLGLNFSLGEINSSLENMNHLTTLIMQNKQIGANSTMAFIDRMKKLTHLDLSFCHIETRILTLVMKAIIPQLTTLKLTNISLTASQFQFIREKGTHLECLHLFCQAGMLSTVSDTVSKLEKLSDFKLHTQPDDTIDMVIMSLNRRTIKKLEFATFKILNYKVTRTSIGKSSVGVEIGGGRIRRQLPQHHRGFNSISSQGLLRLGACRHLTELRLCYVVLEEEEKLADMYDSLSSLEVLELRNYKAGHGEAYSFSSTKHVLTGIDKLKKLKELHLYSVQLYSFSVDYISLLTSLEYLTISDCGLVVESSATVEFWLTEMPKLNVLVLSHLSRPTSLWLNFIHLIFPEEKEDYCNVIFKRKPSTKMWHVI